MSRELERQIASLRRGGYLCHPYDSFDEQMAAVVYANAPIIVWDPDFRITRFNHAFERLTGYAAREVLGQGLRILFPEASREESLDKIARALAGGFWESVEIPILRRDGDVRIALWNSANVYAEDGKTLLATIAQGRDITERKEAEETLRQLSRAVEQSPSTVVITDTRGNIEYVNPKFTQTTGYTAAEALGKNPRILKSGETSPGEYRRLWKTISSGGEWRGEFHNRKRNGELYWESASISPITNAEGAITHFVAVKEDITERKRAEEALQQSNETLRLLSETANDLLSSERPQEIIKTLFQKLSARLGLEVYFNYLVDGEKNQLHLNSYAGVPPQVAAEIEWLDFGEAVCGGVAQAGTRMVAEDIQRSVDPRTDLVRSLGITAYASHPLLAHDRVIGTLSFGTSKRPRFEPHEMALMQAVCDQVGMAMERILLISELQRLYRRAQQAVHMRDEFLSVAAHELKTPLTSLRGFAQVTVRQLEKGNGLSPDRLRRSLQIIDRQSEKLSRLVSQLLDMSRLEAGRLELDRAPTNLRALVEGIVNATRVSATRHSLLLHDGVDVWALADPLRLEQVVTNLIDNAVKYSPPGGTIEAEVWKPCHDRACIAVRDHGVGIAPEHRPHIFDRFYQAHAESHISGMGLGLYITRHIVSLHGGEIEAQFPADGGTRFVVSLPAGLEGNPSGDGDGRS